MDNLTPIMFRKVKQGAFKGDLIAVFPETLASHYKDSVMSYEWQGQHGAASWDWIMSDTEKASPKEYQHLLAHLVHEIGYDNLKTVLKRSSKMREKALKDLRGVK